MQDNRTMRQVVIDRINAYNHGIEYYDVDSVEHHNYDSMSDTEIVKLFEHIVWKSRNVKESHQKEQDKR